ncbi:MAG TPA: phosphate ABC transporter permease subunit PstC [Candidatus Aerophobetes bacterium]|uniref:Phosphate transport system permease protein n=1 Tax=Aerophobetes bacterium TaxID=2030807 RepID=A0A7V5HZL8_UNCAE|nr:phosphate ABC transporter permease subunit PstC [Candidatus Aerophobetes bacterium]
MGIDYKETTDKSLKKISSSELIFRRVLYISAFILVVLVGAVFFSLLVSSFPSLKKLGIRFLFGKTWDPVKGEFGAFSFLVGTLLTSFLALLISLPFSLSISIFLGEYFSRGFFSSFLKSAVEILAGIPSVIYGFWGLFILVPVVRAFEIKLGIMPYGVGIFTASLVLSIMIIPYSATIGREVIQLVPSELKEAAFSLGATKFEVIRKVVLPYARSGILAGILLSLGRALGETMAVTMVIGNANILPDSIFSPSNTMASVIANEFAEATETLHLSSLIEVGLLLFIVTTIVNIIGRQIVKKVSIEV